MDEDEAHKEPRKVSYLAWFHKTRKRKRESKRAIAIKRARECEREPER